MARAHVFPTGVGETRDAGTNLFVCARSNRSFIEAFLPSCERIETHKPDRRADGQIIACPARASGVTSAVPTDSLPLFVTSGKQPLLKQASTSTVSIHLL